jgi:predicted amidohydrolase YtcJ
MKKKADLIIYNAKVYTVDDHFSIADCVIIKEGKILAVGKAEDLMSAYKAADMLDADESYVYPGFHDAHCHFLSYGLGKLQRADLTGTSSFDEVLELVKAHAETNKSEWIEGRGWDQNDWDIKEFPDDG